MSKPKRPAWFKCLLSFKYTIDSVPNEAVGKGFKAALSYFENKEEPYLDGYERIVFCAMRPYIDEAFLDYEASVEAGNKGSKKRWG